MIAQAIKTALETPMDSYESGLHAFFTRINSNWGIKLYQNEWIRDKTYNLQSKANLFGAAPSIGDKFEIKIPKKGYYYGYVTECIIKTHKDLFIEENLEWNEDDWDDDDISNPANIYCDQMEESQEFIELIDKLQLACITSGDMHWANVGWLKNGQLVAIDFSEEDEDNSGLTSWS